MPNRLNSEEFADFVEFSAKRATDQVIETTTHFHNLHGDIDPGTIRDSYLSAIDIVFEVVSTMMGGKGLHLVSDDQFYKMDKRHLHFLWGDAAVIVNPISYEFRTKFRLTDRQCQTALRTIHAKCVERSSDILKGLPNLH